MKHFSIMAVAMLMVTVGLDTPSSAGAPTLARASSPAANRVCKIASKKVHGKKKRVKACKTVKPKPTPTPTPPPAGNVVASIPVPNGFGKIVVAEGAVWLRRENEVVRIDPRTNRVTDKIAAPGRDGLDVGDGSIWVVSPDDNAVSRIDPVTKQVRATIAVGALPEGIVVTPDADWVANHHDGTVSRIDPSTNQVVATISVGPAGAGGPAPMLVSSGALWVRVFNIGAVVRIDPTTDTVVARIHLPGDAGSGGDMTADASGLWVPENGAVVRIDQETNKVTAQIDDNNIDAFATAVGFQSVWVSDTIRGLLRVNPQLNEVTAETPIPGLDDFFIATGAGSIWVERNDHVYRIDPS